MDTGVVVLCFYNCQHVSLLLQMLSLNTILNTTCVTVRIASKAEKTRRCMKGEFHPKSIPYQPAGQDFHYGNYKYGTYAFLEVRTIKIH